MIDLKRLRADPDRYRQGASAKGVDVDIDKLLSLDEQLRSLITEQETLRAKQKRLAKEVGVQIGQLTGKLKAAPAADRAAIETELATLRDLPAQLKSQIRGLDARIAEVEPQLSELLLLVPQPPDPDVPIGASADDNVEIRRWNPPGFDAAQSFEHNRGFAPKTHIELLRDLGLAEFERGVKMAGARSYVLTGEGMRLHNAILRYAFDFMIDRHGFTPVSVPVLVREACMVGTGFFPTGRDQAYHIEESSRGAGQDLFLTGTGEVGLMALRQGEIIDESDLPLRYTTVSTCFRREAGAAGKDTAGLFRIHQFDKVEQVVICAADEAASRTWHATMIGYVEELLQTLSLPYRLLQCCTGDLGAKNADMIDIECWMPGRGAVDDNGRPLGAYAETHSASRLYDYQCRRLNLRYKGESTGGKPVVCHSLNNTVLASPRFLIPLLEMNQNEDGSITIPEPLRPHMSGKDRIG